MRCSCAEVVGMAQRDTSAHSRLRLLAKRWSLMGGVRITVVCVTLVAVAGAVGFVWMGGGLTRQTVVERDGTQDKSQAEVESEIDQGREEFDREGRGTTSVLDAEQFNAPADVPHVVVVHVDGGVAAPGVYELEGQAVRVNDVVVRAGGLTADADTTTVNLAAEVVDGAKVHIPVLGEMVPVTAQPDGAPPSPQVAPTDEAQGSLININTADAAQLVQLPGVGEATAAAIIEERERGGAFAAPEDLMRVSGIGEKKFAKIQGLICV